MRTTLCISIIALLIIIIATVVQRPPSSYADDFLAANPKQTCIWKYCSIDTMKVSRDRARAELNNQSIDTEIQKELQVIKSTGANYVTIDTPYDDEFLPYLKRWVGFARETGLHVWFRGNWSNWEGWFGYPKNMTPDDHLASTSAFIQNNPDLFEDKDIFEPCPECENAGIWDSSGGNTKYNEFIRKQAEEDGSSFVQIGKNVVTNIESISGGRARQTLTAQTIKNLNNVVSIDHYVPDVKTMTDYVDYFSNNFDVKVVISEFGAPVPDINDSMSESQQADFVNSILDELYRENGNVIGLNYWVLSGGSTQILNPDGTKRKVFNIIRNYFSPGIIVGKVTDPLGDPVKGVKIIMKDNATTVLTDSKGQYTLLIPPRTATLTATKSGYFSDSHQVKIATNGATITQNFVITPIVPSLHYQIRMLLHEIDLLRASIASSTSNLIKMKPFLPAH